MLHCGNLGRLRRRVCGRDGSSAHVIGPSIFRPPFPPGSGPPPPTPAGTPPFGAPREGSAAAPRNIALAVMGAVGHLSSIATERLGHAPEARKELSVFLPWSCRRDV